MTGCLFDHKDERDFFLNFSIDNLPDCVDYRPKMPPVFNQGELGSCVSCAICNMMAFATRSEKPFSRLFIYYNGRKIENTIDSDNGIMIRSGLKGLLDNGVPFEEDMPYEIDYFTYSPSFEAYESAKSHTISKYSRLCRSKDQFKACLASGKLFVLCINLFPSFRLDSVRQTGRVEMPGPKEEVELQHGILAVGFNSDCVIFQNSFGKGWGDDGYGYLPWEYLLNEKLSKDFWLIEVAK